MPRKNRRKKPVKHGIEWDSQLELNHYEILNSHPKVKVVKRQHTFLLFEGFKYIGFPVMKKRSYAPFKYTCDFILELEGIDKPVAFESKGYARKDYNLRKKMFIKQYGDEYYFWQVGSVKQLEKELKLLYESD